MLFLFIFPFFNASPLLQINYLVQNLDFWVVSFATHQAKPAIVHWSGTRGGGGEKKKKSKKAFRKNISPTLTEKAILPSLVRTLKALEYIFKLC